MHSRDRSKPEIYIGPAIYDFKLAAFSEAFIANMHASKQEQAKIVLMRDSQGILVVLGDIRKFHAEILYNATSETMNCLDVPGFDFDRAKPRRGILVRGGVVNIDWENAAVAITGSSYTFGEIGTEILGSQNTLNDLGKFVSHQIKKHLAQDKLSLKGKAFRAN